MTQPTVRAGTQIQAEKPNPSAVQSAHGSVPDASVPDLTSNQGGDFGDRVALAVWAIVFLLLGALLVFDLIAGLFHG